MEGRGQVPSQPAPRSAGQVCLNRTRKHHIVTLAQGLSRSAPPHRLPSHRHVVGSSPRPHGLRRPAGPAPQRCARRRAARVLLPWAQAGPWHHCVFIPKPSRARLPGLWESPAAAVAAALQGSWRIMAGMRIDRAPGTPTSARTWDGGSTHAPRTAPHGPRPPAAAPGNRGTACRGERVRRQACAQCDGRAATLHADAEAASRASLRVSPAAHARWAGGRHRGEPDGATRRVSESQVCEPGIRVSQRRLESRHDPQAQARRPPEPRRRAWAIYAGGPDREAGTPRGAVRSVSPSVATSGRAPAAPHHRPWAASCPRSGIGLRGGGGESWCGEWAPRRPCQARGRLVDWSVRVVRVL